MNKKEYAPSAGAMYPAKSKSGTDYFNLVLLADQLPEPNEKGEIRLAGFKNTKRTKDTQPVMRFEASKAGTKPQQGRGNTSTRPAPSRQQASAANDTGDDFFDL